MDIACGFRKESLKSEFSRRSGHSKVSFIFFVGSCTQCFAADGANVAIVPNPDRPGDGLLRIQAINHPKDVPCYNAKASNSTTQWTSGRLNTMGKLVFKYPTVTADSGSSSLDRCSSLFVEARIKVPLVKGYKVGFGLFPEPQTQPPTAKICTVEEECGAYGIWPASGEINTVDHTNDLPSVSHAVQFKANGVHSWLASTTKLNDTAGDWHNYTLEWHCDYIRWYLDGVKVHAVARGDMEMWPFDQPFYLVMGVSVGGNLVGPFVDMSKPGAMFIDYIKVYDTTTAAAVKATAESPAPAPSTSASGTTVGTEVTAGTAVPGGVSVPGALVDGDITGNATAGNANATVTG